jgi:hypothetical protein
MPRRSTFYGVPKDWISNGEWPTCTFRHDAPAEVAVAVAIAKALSQALETRNKTQVASAAQIERSTLYDIIAGRSWPDTVTLAKLERELDQGLWPSHPVDDVDRE